MCTENSGGKEYIINNYNGYIIKPFSSKEIYKKIKILYKDRNTFFIIKNNIKKFVIKDLSWKNYGSRIYNKISKIV